MAEVLEGAESAEGADPWSLNSFLPRVRGEGGFARVGLGFYLGCFPWAVNMTWKLKYKKCAI